MMVVVASLVLDPEERREYAVLLQLQFVVIDCDDDVLEDRALRFEFGVEAFVF